MRPSAPLLQKLLCKPILIGNAALMGMLPLVGFSQESTSDSIEEIMIYGQRQAYRGFTPLEEMPQNVEIFDSELLNQIGITRLDQALELSSSIAKQNTFGGLWDSFAIRGFAGDENVPSGYLVNGFRASRGFSGPRDSSNIEQIEILKGPASALFGRSEPGGTINIITKKPQFEADGYVFVSAGSYDAYRFEGDYTGPISDMIAFRINGAYEESDSFRDHIYLDKYTVTPSVLFAFSDQTSLIYELEVVDQESPFDRGIAAVNNDPGVLSPTTFLGEPGDSPAEIEAIGHQLRFQHDFNANWSILAGLNYQETSFEGFSSDPELVESRQTFILDNENLARQRRFRTFDSEDLSVRIELAGRFDTGPVTHNILIGADAAQFELEAFQTRFRPPSTMSQPGFPNFTDQQLVSTFNAINVFNPVYGNMPDVGPFIHTLEEQDDWGIYFQDQIDLTDSFKATLGVRYNDFEQDITNRRAGTTAGQKQDEVSPRAGLVYILNDTLSLYASYSEGFRSNTGSDVNGKPFQPEETVSYEIGAKISAPNDMLTGTIALFSMEKDGIIVADPINPGFSQAGGEAESQGVELDFSGNITDSLRYIFSYAYIDAEFTKDIADFNFGRFISSGSPLINIPEHTTNLTLIKDIQLKPGKLTLTGNVTYVDDRLGETGVPEYRLPDYTLVHVSATYAPSEKYEISAHINNLFDEEYFPNSFSRFWTAPGVDRTFKVKLKYNF